MSKAKQGDEVRVHYTGKLADGTEFDSSAGREPFQFTIGNGQVIPGFEEAITGMEVGEKKTEVIPPEKAYGMRHEEMVMQVGREQFPDSIQPEVGQQLEMERPDGEKVIVRVAEVSEASVSLDANPPLAGEELTFELELLAIV